MGMKMLMMSVPGVPGEDYPILQQVPLFFMRVPFTQFCYMCHFGLFDCKRKCFQVPEESEFSCQDRIPGGD